MQKKAQTFFPCEPGPRRDALRTPTGCTPPRVPGAALALTARGKGGVLGGQGYGHRHHTPHRGHTGAGARGPRPGGLRPHSSSASGQKIGPSQFIAEYIPTTIPPVVSCRHGGLPTRAAAPGAGPGPGLQHTSFHCLHNSLGLHSPHWDTPCIRTDTGLRSDMLGAHRLPAASHGVEAPVGMALAKVLGSPNARAAFPTNGEGRDGCMASLLACEKQ
jgi:hypothetical protein